MGQGCWGYEVTGIDVGVGVVVVGTLFNTGGGGGPVCSVGGTTGLGDSAVVEVVRNEASTLALASFSAFAFSSFSRRLSSWALKSPGLWAGVVLVPSSCCCGVEAVLCSTLALMLFKSSICSAGLK